MLKRFWILILIPFLVFESALLTPTMARAEGTQNMAITNDAQFEVGFSQACGKTYDQAQANGDFPQLTTQAKTYCTSAVSSMQAAKSNNVLWPIWTSVAASCAVLCAASVVVPVLQDVCTGIDVAATVGDAIATQNFQSIVTGLGTAMMSGIAAHSGGSPASSEMSFTEKNFTQDGIKSNLKDAKAAPGKTAGKVIACLLVPAAAAFNAYQKKQTADASVSSAYTNVSQAMALVSAQKGSHFQGPNGGLGAQGSGSPGTGLVGNSGGSSISGGGDSGTISCFSGCSAATALDSKLPFQVGSAQYPEAFQKTTGINLDQFLNRAKAAGPGAAISAVLGSVVGGEVGNATAQAMKDLESLAATSPEASQNGVVYSNGAKRGASVGEPDPDMNQMMTDMMAKFMPQKPGEKGVFPTGVTSLLMAYKTRPASAIAEDRAISIFDRLTFRYFFVGKKLTEGDSVQ